MELCTTESFSSAVDDVSFTLVTPIEMVVVVWFLLIGQPDIDWITIHTGRKNLLVDGNVVELPTVRVVVRSQRRENWQTIRLLGPVFNVFVSYRWIWAANLDNDWWKKRPGRNSKHTTESIESTSSCGKSLDRLIATWDATSKDTRRNPGRRKLLVHIFSLFLIRSRGKRRKYSFQTRKFVVFSKESAFGGK